MSVFKKQQEYHMDLSQILFTSCVSYLVIWSTFRNTDLCVARYDLSEVLLK